MCGIAGIVGAVKSTTVAATERMLDALVHRGPDQHGLWRSNADRGAVLGHRRLSILDLSEAGRQPMVDRATGVVIAFNGECYNFLELRAELESLGRNFVSTGDTEVLLAAYVEWGESAIAKLRGMFAFAVWDPRDETLLLARDRLGIKPLYYARHGDDLIFASELRAVLASGSVAPRMDPRALHSFLWHGFVPGPRTIVQDVRLLEAGTTLRIDRRGNVSKNRYWQFPRYNGSGDGEECVKNAKHSLRQAVSEHLLADVPLGVFLSGGVDSSVVAAMAMQASSKRVTTFNIRFDEARYDESPFARRIAERLGTDHHEVTLSETAFEAQFDDALQSIDQPTFDAINTYFVSRAVRESGLIVALAGTGGDELFGGYGSFVDVPKARIAARNLRWLPKRSGRGLARALSRVVMGPASEVYPQTRWGKLADVLGTCGDLVGLYQVSYGLFSQEMLDDLALKSVEDIHWGLDPGNIAELDELVRGEPHLHAISTLELASFLRERLLRDTDAASMAVSLEVRVPLLDHAFVDSLAQVPENRRFHPLRKKTLLKEMVSDQLDPSLFDRDKAGFELPLAVWCRRRLSPRLEETFQDINLAHAVGLDAESVGRLWRAFSKGGPGVYWSRVWSLFVFMNWCRRYGVYA